MQEEKEREEEHSNDTEKRQEINEKRKKDKLRRREAITAYWDGDKETWKKGTRERSRNVIIWDCNKEK